MDMKTVSEIVVNFTEAFANLGTAAISFVLAIFAVWGLQKLWPVLKRLGIGLKTRAIWVVSEDFDGLQRTIEDSGIFNKKNIHPVPLEMLDRADDLIVQDYLKDKTLIIMEYKKDTAGSDINEQRLHKILKKNPKAGLIVLAEGNRVMPEASFTETGKMSNTTIVNARGRLLNDIWNTMATTDPQEKGLWDKACEWVSSHLKK